jgi:ribosome biogenesis GTPase
MLPPDTVAVAVDALGDEPLPRLQPWLQAGQTLVLLGSSGAGKSTLTNALCRQQVADTGANRSGDSRGRHTTTVRSLHVTPAGRLHHRHAGLRTCGWTAMRAELDAAFDDIAQLALQCRFRDCRHEAEPGCAVRRACLRAPAQLPEAAA